MSNNNFTRRAALAITFAFVLSSTPTHSFVPSNNVPRTSSSPQTSTSIGIFGGLKDAFGNDDSLGAAKNAGLSNGPRYNEQVTVNGKPVKNVVVDQKISQVCATARVKVPYNCQNGECGTCTVKLNGRKARACVSKVPAGKCTIQTL
mmetsp:Transcript_22177/g.47704  ORF Transcript_22177/g.47704 Transcript_22177/m.47704 type:complete len:147 (-) Transcript_22177:319-759(-)|eukprot:CAMPEP_0172551998 /NCGR_PEP_ID=MMETSP1067-20121228/43004_1 /TAXON_ID=265564 ORGANISM="Thalassiosira punctigera, Strain Tpunct2005C2" /NCGR_SAMPLE_ID=MMETSP1067 /ASSEMBLY_ACC=CAM_ASM_000444 /LENGTH=146 /DNA_ID=CAMNT_0013339893 /DNA_START=203 /DNA_END=643 /DNA_ORIENTATION=+